MNSSQVSCESRRLTTLYRFPVSSQFASRYSRLTMRPRGIQPHADVFIAIQMVYKWANYSEIGPKNQAYRLKPREIVTTPDEVDFADEMDGNDTRQAGRLRYGMEGTGGLDLRVPCGLGVSALEFSTQRRRERGGLWEGHWRGVRWVSRPVSRVLSKTRSVSRRSFVWDVRRHTPLASNPGAERATP